MMKERPIIFSAPMVQAILAGNKTQTRRIMKPQPVLTSLISRADSDSKVLALHHHYSNAPGDQLWVRENFMVEPNPVDLGLTREMIPHTWDAVVAAAGTIHYAADPGALILADGRPWKPSIHMPRWASRIQLEITSIRVERLQDISEADAKAEGADCLISDNATPETRSLLNFPLMENGSPYRNGFAHLWELINGDGAWAKNPWVWVIEFRRIKP
ncbi:hypothetical protein ACKF11_11545 [Methylobacillus sp. Pita2]|uniref:hypothetical protein n=1 Tax=Methylobacillus sp. Pita2 TaxID=3383245 RepID=UPI0038B53A47